MTEEDFLKATQRKRSESTEKSLTEINHYTTVQKITIVTANEDGVYMGTRDLDVLPKKQFLSLSRPLSDEGITRLIKHGFCDFIDAKDSGENQFYLEKITRIKNPIHAANWLGLYRKISALTDIIANAADGMSTDKDRQFLNEEVRENVREIMIDRNSLAYRETMDADTEENKNELLDSFGPKNLRDKSLTEGYQIFGHIALCCLELLLEMDKGQLLRFCKNPDCGIPLPDHAHGNQKTCLMKDNPTCHKAWRSRSKRNERSGIKTKNNRPKKAIPSRRFV